MNKKTICLVKYFGGKYYLCKKILSLFPPHKTYVEPFGGAGTLLINKEPSTVEVYNDKNEYMVNLMRVIRDYDLLKRFLRIARLVPHSRAEFYHFRVAVNTETDIVKRAVMYFYLLHFGFSGKSSLRNCSFAYNVTSKYSINAYHSHLDLLRLISKRLTNVTIECNDFRQVIKVYDTPDTLFYVDPPYLHETRNSFNNYEYELSNDDHAELCELLKDIKGKFILSGFENGLYNSYGWNKVVLPNTYSAYLRKNGAKYHRDSECVWMNFEPGSQEAICQTGKSLFLENQLQELRKE